MSSPEIKQPGYGSETGLERTRSMLSVENSTDGAFFEAADVLSNRFDSLRLVAARRNADYYLAREKAAGSGLIALKVLPAGAARNPHQLGLFRLEARSAAKLEHGNILKTSPPEEFNGIHYSRIEHQPRSESLKSLIEREGWLDEELATEIIYQIADALEHAHERGVLHLRVQPENILIDPNGKATLAEFGIDSRTDLAGAHYERASLCPAHYISPEQVQGGTLDSRSDLYSLGVVFYQMLTDRLPVDCADSDSVRTKHLTQTPLPPHLYSSSIPLALSEVVTRLLEKEPARRFQDVASFRLALEKAVQPPVRAALPSDQPPAKQEEQKVAPAPDNPTIAREPWEDPSIIRIEHEEVPVSKVESPSSAVQSEEAKPRGLDLAGRSIDRPSFHLMPEASKGASLSPLVLVVVLAAAVLFGILVIAYFNSATNPSPRSLPNRGHVADPAQTVENVSTDGQELKLANNPPAPEPPAAGNASSLPNSAALPATKPANSAVSKRPTASKRWRPARTTNKPKRKSRRSTRYGSTYFSERR